MLSSASCPEIGMNVRRPKRVLGSFDIIQHQGEYFFFLCFTCSVSSIHCVSKPPTNSYKQEYLSIILHSIKFSDSLRGFCRGFWCSQHQHQQACTVTIQLDFQFIFFKVLSFYKCPKCFQPYPLSHQQNPMQHSFLVMTVFF